MALAVKKCCMMCFYVDSHFYGVYMFAAMKYKTFSVRIPEDLCTPLETEASEELRNRNQMLIKILRDRYHSHAPPTAPIQKRSSQSRTATSRAGRKTSDVN